MSEGLVGLRHPVDVVLALPGPALLLGGVEYLSGEALAHRFLPTPPRELDEPADREGARSTCLDLDGHLVGGPADPPRADLEDRGQLLYRLVEHLDGRPAGALADDRQRVVDDPLRKRALAVVHDLVDHLLDEAASVPGVGLYRP